MTWRHWVLFAIAAALVLGVILHDPIPQDPDYHAFADRRPIFGIPNFSDVISNLPFLIVGIVGLRSLRKTPAGALSLLNPAYVVFFVGTILISFGSAFYHLDPDNSTLTWDRLPMTIAFMAFVSIVIGEHVSARAGRQLLPILIVLGMSSVLYWRFTEMHGRGDLRPYFVVQFLPMVLIPLIMLLFPSALSKVYFIWGTLITYAAAKVFELLDERVYLASGGLSGHTLKHLTAAAGVYCVVLAIRRRTVIRTDTAPRPLLYAE